jgi:hypothetical protein
MLQIFGPTCFMGVGRFCSQNRQNKKASVSPTSWRHATPESSGCCRDKPVAGAILTDNSVVVVVIFAVGCGGGGGDFGNKGTRGPISEAAADGDGHVCHTAKACRFNGATKMVKKW